MKVENTRHLRLVNPGPERRDRYELLMAVINAPSFDPVLRAQVIDFPDDHPVFRWRCVVRDCPRPRNGNKTACGAHEQQWLQARKAGVERAEFLRGATPMEGVSLSYEPARCQICVERPARGPEWGGLCHIHARRWRAHRKDCPNASIERWLPSQEPLPTFGPCLATGCIDLACSEQGLCEPHVALHRWAGAPGRWRVGSERGKPGSYTDPGAFTAWCTAAPTPVLPSRLNLSGLPRLVQAEMQYGLFAHSQVRHFSDWPPTWIQQLINRSSGAQSLLEVPADTLPHGPRLVAIGIQQSLRLLYTPPTQTREDGYLEFAHFGAEFGRSSRLDLTDIAQRWLRDLLWDYFAERLRSPKCPRNTNFFQSHRRAIAELSCFLTLEAPDSGHDPALLDRGIVDAFVADQKHRGVHGLSGLAPQLRNNKPVTVSDNSIRAAFNNIRQVMRWALDESHTARIGIPTDFITAFPFGDKIPTRTRRPFSDDVARALVEEDNLARFAESQDSNDIGLRDVWEAMVFTGRRTAEIVKLRLDCLGRYQGLPVLWHDQTKVGNFDEAVRIPERLYELIERRQQKTLLRFETRHNRLPTAQERRHLALFPSRYRNPSGRKNFSPNTFAGCFRTWVGELDLGAAVPHQARHTLATRLLAAGADLHHLRRYLGHLSIQMTEHYAKISPSAVDEALARVWVTGPGSPDPGRLLATDIDPADPQAARAMAIDLSRLSTPTEGGMCTFQPVVLGDACPWKLDCTGCDHFVMSGADLVYWQRKREQWYSIAERAPDDATAVYLREVFAPTARAIDGLEQALAGLGLLDEALDLDLRRPQDYFARVWSLGFRSDDLMATTASEGS